MNFKKYTSTLLSFFIFTAAHTSFAGPSCRQLIAEISSTAAPAQRAQVRTPERTTNVAPATRAPRVVRDTRTPVEKFKEVKIETSEKQKISQLISEFDIAEYKDISDLAQKLADRISIKNKTEIEKSDELAQISNQVYEVLEKRIFDFFENKQINREQSQIYNFSKADVQEYIERTEPQATVAAKKARVTEILKEYDTIRLDLMKVKFNFSEQIAKLEAFKIEEYVPVEDHPLTNPDYTLISLSEYPAFAMALAKDKAPPKPYGDGGVVSLKEYRDVVSTNLWLFTLEGHDLKHIHFANSHPMAAAAMFRATRSKNHLRYFLIAGLFEGVDTVQYYWETQLAEHFSNKGFTLEQAMIHLASAPQSELRQIAAEVGKNQDYGDSQFDGWVPSLIPADKLPANAKTPDQLEQDILDFMKKSLEDLANPEINIYMRPELIPDGMRLPPGTSEKPGEEIHH